MDGHYLEGLTCPLARLGHNRDGKPWKPQIVFGLLCNAEGCPVAVEVLPGDTGDPPTLHNQIRKVRERFGIEREAALDGIYVIRTSEPKERLSPQAAVRGYKSLSQVEQAIRSLKSLDLLLRSIHHRTDPRVRAHIFVCMLDLYVEFHMRKALGPLLFDDEVLEENRQRRDSVKSVLSFPSVREKKTARQTSEGFPVQSFQSLLAHLTTRCSVKGDPDGPAFDQVTDPTPLQRKALELLRCSQ